MLCILLSLLLLLRLPGVQTFVAGKTASYLSDKLNTEVKVGSVHVTLSDIIVLNDLLIRDLHGDTLASVSRVNAKISLIDFSPVDIRLHSIELEDPVFKLARYKGEDFLNLNFLKEAFKSKDSTSIDLSLQLSALKINNGKFSYVNHNKDIPDRYGVQWNDLAISSINLNMDGMEVFKDSVKGVMKSLTFKEKSGFKLNQLSGLAYFSKTGLRMNKMDLITPHTNLQGNLAFNYDSLIYFQKFTSKIKIRSSFDPSSISFNDIAFFAPELEGLNRRIIFKGDVFGTIRQLRGRDVTAKLGRHTSFTGNVDINGLPYINETFLRLDVDKLVTSKSDLDSLPLPPFKKGNTVQTPANFAQLGLIRFNGEFSGFFNDFVAYGTFNTNLGEIRTDLSLRFDSVSSKSSYSGTLALNQFNAGKFFNLPWLGTASGKADVEGRGFSKEDIAAKLKGEFNGLEINGYNYSNIVAEGDLSQSIFVGDLTVNDPNLGMVFSGEVNAKKKIPEFNFISTIHKANLTKLNIGNRDSSASLSTNITINLKGNSFDNLEGSLKILDTKFSESDTEYNLNKLNLIATRTGTSKSFFLNSDYVDANIKGEYNIGYLPKALNNHFKAILDSSYVDNEGPKQDFIFRIDVKNLDPVTELFYPQLNVSGQTYFTGSYNNKKHIFQLNGNSPDVYFHGFRFKNYFVNAASPSVGTLNLSTGSERMQLNDNIYIQNLLADLKTLNDSLALNLRWNNNSTPSQQASISGNGTINSLQDIKFKFAPSDIIVSDTLWTLNGNNLVSIDSGTVSINDLSLVSSSQKMIVNGDIGKKEVNPLEISFENFLTSNFNPLTQKKKITLGGLVSGNLTFANLKRNPSISSNLKLSGFIFNGEELGDGNLISRWNSKKEALEINARLFRESLAIAEIKGDYFPFREEENLDLVIDLNKVRLYVLNPFFEGIFTDINGIASGTVKAKGTLEKPLLKGRLQLQRTSLTVDYLKTSYSFSGDMRVEPTWFGFDNISIFDSQGNRGYFTGTIFHENFKKFNLDMLIDGERMMALNTTLNDNPLYYGQAFFTGSVSISGYAEKLLIDVKGKTEKGTQLNFPLGGSEEITASSFIRFVSTEERKKEDPYKVDLTGVEMTMEVDVTPDAEIQLIFDPAIGDIMKGRGTGRLNMNITQRGDFTIFGNFTIQEGEYLFTLMNVINKKFRVEQGGTIDFSGDIYKATIDVTAVYKLRTSLKDIGLDQTNSGQRYPVETILHLSNDLMQPDINFDIQLPSADENTRSLLRTIVANEEERNRQTFALLTLNHFVAPQSMGDPTQEAHGNIGVTTGVASSSELLSNQLSNWLSQISKDFDIGVNYRPGDDITNEELEVALSTQILNDRVLIDGNFGIATDNATTDANTLVDGTIEYKLSEDGNFRVKAFNKSDPYRIADNGNPNRQGVGIFYRLEFDTLEELWQQKIKGIFRRKKNKNTN